MYINKAKVTGTEEKNRFEQIKHFFNETKVNLKESRTQSQIEKNKK